MRRKTIFFIIFIGITAAAGSASACPKNVVGIFGCPEKSTPFLPWLYEIGPKKQEFSVGSLLRNILRDENAYRRTRSIRAGELEAIVRLLGSEADRFQREALPRLIRAMNGNPQKEQFAHGIALAFQGMTSALEAFNRGDPSGLQALYFQTDNSQGLNGIYEPDKKHLSLTLPAQHWDAFLENPAQNREFDPFMRILVHELGHYIFHQRAEETPISPIEFSGVEMASHMLTEVISYAEQRAWGRNGQPLLENMASLVKAADLADFIHKDALWIRSRHPRYRFEKSKWAKKFFNQSHLTPAEQIAQMAQHAAKGAQYLHFPR